MKLMVPPDCLHDYIMGDNSCLDKEDLEEYKEKLVKLLKQKYPKKYLRVYRGFSSPAERHELGEIFTDHTAIISFTTSKSTAVEIARERALENDEFGYAIAVDIPIEQIYFHYAFDEIGKAHPKEKEVIIDPYGFDWEIVEYIKPRKYRES